MFRKFNWKLISILVIITSLFSQSVFAAENGNVVDIMPIWELIWTGLAVFLLTLLKGVFKEVKSWIKEKTGIDMEFKIDKYLDSIFNIAKKRSKNKIKKENWDTLEFENQIIAEVVDLAVEKIPEVASGIISIEWIKSKAESLLELDKERGN